MLTLAIATNATRMHVAILLGPSAPTRTGMGCLPRALTSIAGWPQIQCIHIDWGTSLTVLAQHFKL